MTACITTLAIGHITHDRYGERILPGGCVYYAAQTWKALGACSRLVTIVGEDFDWDQALRGLESQMERKGQTTTFVNLYPGSRRRLQYLHAQAPPIEPVGLPDSWLRPDVLFLVPVLHEVDLGAWRQAVPARITAVGIQGYLRARDPEPKVGRGACRIIPEPWSPDPGCLQGVDVACLSQEDLIGQGDLLERLCDSIPLVALTRGSEGCDIIQKEKTTRIGIHPARQLDPTGAGDTFAAGFLFGLAQGQNPTQAARLGAACASIIVEGLAGEAFPRMKTCFERAARVR